MGGMNGELRGTSKIDVYVKYVDFCGGYLEDWSQSPDSRYKKACKAAMVQDSNTGEWVLRYHVHS